MLSGICHARGRISDIVDWSIVGNMCIAAEASEREDDSYKPTVWAGIEAEGGPSSLLFSTLLYDHLKPLGLGWVCTGPRSRRKICGEM